MDTWNKLEEANGFLPTKVVGSNESEQFIVLRCSREWLDNPTLLNILTATLRLMCYTPKEDKWFDKHPYEYLLNATQGFCQDKILLTETKNCSGNVDPLPIIFHSFGMWAKMEQKHVSLTNKQLQGLAYESSYTLHNGSGFKSVICYCIYMDQPSEFKNKLNHHLAAADLLKEAA
jgi:hypothetical protein